MPRPWSFLIFAFALLFTTEIGVEACGPGFEPFFDGRCVQVLVGSPNYYEPWSKKCSDQGALPITIRSKSENEALPRLASAYAEKYGITAPKETWIGLTCDPSKAKFVWADGTTANYTNFRDVNTCTSGSYADHFYMNFDTQKWIKYNDNNEDTMICMHQHLTNEPCDEMNIISSENTKSTCVSISHDTKNWTDAEKTCATAFGHLTSIHDENANNFIRRSAVAMQHTAGVHIGAFATTNGSTLWKDGTSMDYKNFYPGFPDVEDYGECVAMQIVPPFNGKWANIACDTTLPYVCGRPAFDYSSSLPPGCPATPQYHPGEPIYSPGFPSNGTALECGYVLSVPKGKTIEVRVVVFEANLCCDTLTLYDGLFTMEPLAVLSGFIGPGTTYTSTTNSLRMDWNATSAVNIRGFHFEMRAI